MLPIVLVSLALTSALAAPTTTSLTVYNIDEVPAPVDNGRLVNGGVLEAAFETIDGGNLNANQLTVQQILTDLASQSDNASQTLAVSEALGLLIYLAPAATGDVCEAAVLIEAYVNGVATGNYSAFRAGLENFFKRIATESQVLVALSNNPDALRNSVGYTTGCAGGGRTYSFEAAWDAILANTNPNTNGLVNELFCAAKRLYGSTNLRNRNLAAMTTVLALPPVQRLFQSALPEGATVLRNIANGVDAGPAAQAAISKLYQAVGQLRF